MALTTVYFARECGEFPYTKCIVPLEAKEWFIEEGACETEAEATERLLGTGGDTEPYEDDLQRVGKAESNDLGRLKGRLNEFKRLAKQYLGAHND